MAIRLHKPRNFILAAIAFLLSQSYSYSADSSLSATYDWQTPISEKSKKTVEDYFLLLPSSILDCEYVSHGLPTRVEREKIIGKKDIRNGYLGFFKTAQIAVFKNRSDKSDVIAIQVGKSGAGTTCGGLNTLLQFDSTSKAWKKREDLLPKGFTFEELYERYSGGDVYPYFDLPQKGLDLQIKEEGKDSVLSVLKWNGTRFVLKK